MNKEEQLDYLAGFFDAEGCVYFSNNGRQQQVMYAIGQSAPAVLYLFQQVFGGSVRKREEATDRHQEQWLWQKACVRSDGFYGQLAERCVIKRSQFELAYKFSQTLRAPGGRRNTVTAAIVDERESIGKMIRLAKGSQFDNEGILVPGMPISYWAGLFDGDGSAGILKNKRCFYPRASMFSSYIPILECARRQFAGYVFEHRSKRAREWRSTNQTAEAFLRQVEPHVIVKANVVRSVLALRDLAISSRGLMTCNARGWNRRFPDSVILEMDSIASRIRELNRQGPNRVVA